MSAKDATKRHLASHPRTIGALFTLLLLLGQAGSAVAGQGSGQVGP